MSTIGIALEVVMVGLSFVMLGLMAKILIQSRKGEQEIS